MTSGNVKMTSPCLITAVISRKPTKRPLLARLTPEQGRLLPVVRGEGLPPPPPPAPADGGMAGAGRRPAYRGGGLDPPAAVIWLGSPLAGVVAATILRALGNEPDVMLAESYFRHELGVELWGQDIGAP